MSYQVYKFVIKQQIELVFLGILGTQFFNSSFYPETIPFPKKGKGKRRTNNRVGGVVLAPNDMKYSVCVHAQVKWPLNWTAVVIPVYKHRMGINLLIY